MSNSSTAGFRWKYVIALLYYFYFDWLLMRNFWNSLHHVLHRKHILFININLIGYHGQDCYLAVKKNWLSIIHFDWSVTMTFLKLLEFFNFLVVSAFTFQLIREWHKTSVLSFVLFIHTNCQITTDHKSILTVIIFKFISWSIADWQVVFKQKYFNYKFV